MTYGSHVPISFVRVGFDSSVNYRHQNLHCEVLQLILKSYMGFWAGSRRF
jgi:hypothetical protein